MTNIHKNNFNIDETIWAGWEVFKKQWKNLLWAIFAYIVATIPLSIIDALWQMRLYAEDMNIPEGEIEALAQQVWVAGTSETALYIVFSVIMFAWSIIIGFNLFKASFRIFDGHKFQFSEMFAIPNESKSIQHIGRYLAVIVLFTLIVLSPMLFTGLAAFVIYLQGLHTVIIGSAVGISLIVTAILASFVASFYLAIRYSFASYLVVDKNLTIREAFLDASKMTENIKWKLIGLGLVQVALFLGIIVAGLICLLVGVIPAYFIAVSWIMFSSIFLMRKLHDAIKS